MRKLSMNLLAGMALLCMAVSGCSEPTKEAVPASSAKVSSDAENLPEEKIESSDVDTFTSKVDTLRVVYALSDVSDANGKLEAIAVPYAEYFKKGTYFAKNIPESLFKYPAFTPAIDIGCIDNTIRIRIKLGEEKISAMDNTQLPCTSTHPVAVISVDASYALYGWETTINILSALRTIPVNSPIWDPDYVAKRVQMSAKKFGLGPKTPALSAESTPAPVDEHPAPPVKAPPAPASEVPASHSDVKPPAPPSDKAASINNAISGN